METWMSNFHNLLTLDNKLLQTEVSDVTAVWEEWRRCESSVGFGE